MVADVETSTESSVGRPGRKTLVFVVAALLIGLAITLTVWRITMKADPPVVTDPSREELISFAETRVFFGHQSVGSNVLTGLQQLGADVGAAVHIVETSTAVPGEGGLIAHSYVGVNGDPMGKLEAFADTMDGPSLGPVDVALVKLCYVDVTAETDVEAVFAAYVRTIDALQLRHPETTFLYATVPLVTERDMKAVIKSWLGRNAGMDPADNVARQRFNALMRDRYSDSAVLFDIAAVEAAMDQAPASRAADGDIYYALNDAYAADPGHLNALGARAVAGELVRVVTAVRP